MTFAKIFEKFQYLFDIRGELDVDAAIASIKNNSNFQGMNIWILACAIVIASLGLNVNSTAVIIGAMLISPLMGPIIGMGLAVGINDLTLMRSALHNLAKMMLVSVAFSTLFFVLSPLNMQHPSELLARTNPTIYDVLIAFVGGLAGALETSRKEKGTVISGVAIATALMPPLCTVGYGLSILDFHIALGAFYLFFINCVFVAMATFLVVKFVGFPKTKHIDPKVARRASNLAWLLIAIFVVPSIISAISVIRENNFNNTADKFVESVRKNICESVIYEYKTDTHEKPYTVTLYIAGKRLSDADKETIYSAAEEVFDLGRHQILFETALAGVNDSEFEKQVYKDLSTNVADLQQKVCEYESQQLPYAQIRSEVAAQYPDLAGFSLARGEKEIFAIVQCAPGDSIDTSRLALWLKVRLGGDEDVVIISK